MLFALACPERISSLAKLDLRYLHVHPEGVTFTLASPRKSGRPDKPADTFFARYKQNTKLCPVECLRYYSLKSTRKLWSVSPYSKPCRQTVCFFHSPLPTCHLYNYWALVEMHHEKCRNGQPYIQGTLYVVHRQQQLLRPLFHCPTMAMADWSSPTFRTFYYKPNLRDRSFNLRDLFLPSDKM